MTHRTFWIVLVLGALVASPWWPGSTAEASNEIAERLELKCTHCHDKPGSRLLTDEGKYWEVMGSFEGFDEVSAAFGTCTGCHVKKPGSLKLTRNGRDFARLVGDMEGLKRFLEEQHPLPDAEEAPEDDAGDPEKPPAD